MMQSKKGVAVTQNGIHLYTLCLKPRETIDVEKIGSFAYLDVGKIGSL